jgi:hypothetical protein
MKISYHHSTILGKVFAELLVLFSPLFSKFRLLQPCIYYFLECLALPKLNLQFLTLHDYLLRNLNLFRLESTCKWQRIWLVNRIHWTHLIGWLGRLNEFDWLLSLISRRDKARCWRRSEAHETLVRIYSSPKPSLVAFEHHRKRVFFTTGQMNWAERSFEVGHEWVW